MTHFNMNVCFESILKWVAGAVLDGCAGGAARWGALLGATVSALVVGDLTQKMYGAVDQLSVSIGCMLCYCKLTVGTHIWMMECQHNILFGDVGF